MTSKKDRPTRTQAAARRDQRTLAERLKVWREGRRDKARDLAAKRRKAEAKARKKSKATRGVDRVPERYRVTGPAPVYVVQHTDAPYRWRRRHALNTGRTLTSSDNQPHVNPARDQRKGARLRKAES